MKRRAFLRGLGAAGGLAFAPGLGRAAPAARGRAVDRLREAKIQIGSRIKMIARGADSAMTSRSSSAPVVLHGAPTAVPR